MLASDCCTPAARAGEHPPAPSRGDDDTEDGEENGDDDEQLAAPGIEKATPPLTGPREEDDEQADVHDPAAEHVEPHAGHGLGGRDAGLLQVADVQSPSRRRRPGSPD